MNNVYIVLRKATGEMALGRTYSTVRDAKIALKNRIFRPNWPLYAVAAVKIDPTIVATVDDSGNWADIKTEVTAE